MPIQDRPTQYLIKTGDYFDDAVANIVEIIKRMQVTDPGQYLTWIKRVHEVYPADLLIVPETPCICVDFVDHEEEIHTIGKKNVTYELQIGIEIYYYHQQINEELREKEIRSALWELGRILRRNSFVNGLSSKGARIVSSEVLNRTRLNGVYAGGRVRYNVPVLIQEQRGD